MSHRPTNPNLDDADDLDSPGHDASEAPRPKARVVQSFDDGTDTEQTAGVAEIAGVAEHRVPAMLPFSDGDASRPRSPFADLPPADEDDGGAAIFDDEDGDAAEDAAAFSEDGDSYADDEAVAELLRRSAAVQPEVETESAPQTLPLPRLRSVLESLLFVADKPLTVQRLIEILEEQAQEPSGQKGPPLYQPAQVQDALQSLADSYLRDERGVELHQVAGGWQLRTAPANASWVQRQLQQKPQRLSRAQLETMTIVAYRQPITRPEIDDVRGVDSGAALKTLLERRLVRILGKKEEPGRPLLYGTTREFLEFFNLRDLKDLPTLREYYELNDENKARVRAAHPDGSQPSLPVDGGMGPARPDGPQQIALPDTEGPPPAPPMAPPPAPPIPGLLVDAPPVPPSPPPISRVEILDQQLADDAEQLATIDALIASVRDETPPIDVLLGMAEAAAMAEAGAATQDAPATDEDEDQASPEDAPISDGDDHHAVSAEPGDAALSGASNSTVDPATATQRTARRGRKKAQDA